MLQVMKVPSCNGAGRSHHKWKGVETSVAAEPVVLAQFSTRLAPELLERLRVAAPQLRMRQTEITAAALDEFLSRRGF
jgi:hypothetical protein